MIGHGDVWTGTSSIEIPLQIQFLDRRSGGHRCFRLRIQDVFRGKTVMVRVV